MARVNSGPQVPAEVDWLDEHVGDAGAGVRVEVDVALHAIVRPRQHDEEAVVGAEDLACGHDVDGHAEEGGAEIAGQHFVAVVIHSSELWGQKPSRTLSRPRMPSTAMRKATTAASEYGVGPYSVRSDRMCRR